MFVYLQSLEPQFTFLSVGLMAFVLSEGVFRGASSGVNASSRLGGRSAKGDGAWGHGEGVFTSPAWGSGEVAVPPPQKILCFVISKWRILVNSKVLNLKYVIILNSIPMMSPKQNIGDVSPGIRRPMYNFLNP